MTKSEPFTVAVISTYRRPLQLQRLLECLEQVERGLGAVLVIDNADDAETRAACEGRKIDVQWLPQKANLGCGGGLRFGEEQASSRYPHRMTHLWILDDDAVVPPTSLGSLLAAMVATNASAASPMLLDENGKIGWFAGLLDAKRFAAIRRASIPEDYLRECGEAPVPFSWATGISLLVSRLALDTIGLHRTDFWLRGEDLEFSLRLTARFRGVFVPGVCVWHIPPVGEETRAEYRKRLAHLQNVAYIALHLPHGRRILHTVPGHIYRFLRDTKWSPTHLLAIGRVLWHAAILGLPAGAERSAERRSQC